MEFFPIECFADQTKTIFKKHWEKFIEERNTIHSVCGLNKQSLAQEVSEIQIARNRVNLLREITQCSNS